MSGLIVTPISPERSVLPHDTHTVVMLDLDGVLQGLITHSLDELVPARVVRLNTIERPGVAWILSSSWRYHTSIEEVTRHLRRCGWTGELSGATPLWRNDHRGETIRQWCWEHGWTGRVVVIDDDPDVEPYKAQSVRVDPEVGLTDEDVARAVEMLGRIGQ